MAWTEVVKNPKQGMVILQRWTMGEVFGSVRHRVVYYPKLDKLTVEYYSRSAKRWLDHTEGCMETCFWGL